MGNATEVGWVPGPDGRGTLNIIWTCLSTLFLCLWASWHPDIPEEDSKKRESAWTEPINKTGWVLFLLLLPEAGVMTSVSQTVLAYRCARTLRKEGYTNWKFQHCIYAEMGGIELAQKDDSSAAGASAGDPESQRATKVYCSGLLYLKRKKRLPQEPPISGAEIRQMSKSDFIVKTIALVQVIWFLVSSIARTAQGLPVAQLEVVCLAYVFYAAVVYIAWWYKPLDIATAVQLQPAPAQGDAPDLIELPESSDQYSTRFKSAIKVIASDGLDDWKSVIWAALFAVFGGIHCASWDSSFDSVAEKQLWRASSVVLTASYSFLLVETYFSRHPPKSIGRFVEETVEVIALASFLVTVSVYVAARMYILVEAFVILRRSPSALYETVDWMKFIPHIN